MNKVSGQPDGNLEPPELASGQVVGGEKTKMKKNKEFTKTSKKNNLKGLCGEAIKFKHWKQGRSYGCNEAGVTVIHWGKAHEDHSDEAIRILCNCCARAK